MPAVDLAGAAARARVLLLAVKPQDIDVLLARHGRRRGRRATWWCPWPPGVPTTRIEAALPPGTPVVRVMPNTPALVDEGMSVLSAGAHAGEQHLDEAEALLAAVGRVRRVPESQQDAVTALSGSGPAYFFYLVEAMVDAGILLGLPRTLAADLVVQTALGAAVMMRDSGEHPVQLREAVSSPGGTTVAAIRELERHGVRAALMAAIEAAHARSVELGAAAGTSQALQEPVDAREPWGECGRCDGEPRTVAHMSTRRQHCLSSARHRVAKRAAQQFSRVAYV